MNALMRIRVQVVSGDVQAQLAKINAAVKQVETTANRSGGGGGFFASLGGSLLGLGKNLQWTGRQIEYAFTLPLVAAGGFATKWALANERATTRVRKVYGDLSTSTQQVNSDVKELGRAFEALSNIFGVAQSDVINIAADWAQAGAAGVSLAKSTRATLEAMVLGEMDAKDSAQSLIAIQTQWQLSSDQLRQALAVLNVVENQTAADFPGLIDAFVRGGGSARSAGVDIRHFAALVAAITPAAGSAAQAGNSLKTIFSRLLAPTKDAADIMKLIGINTGDASWQMQNGAQRLETLAKKFQDLTPAQQAVASSTIATRFQVARFEVLMRDILNPIGMYQRALDASADSTRNMQVYTRELGIYLRSSPQAFKILWTQLQNALAKIIIPLLPALLALMSRVVQLVDAFTRLSPVWQQLILAGLGFLALLGPVLKYVGSFMEVLSVLGTVLEWVGGLLVTVGSAIAGAFASPIVIAIAAVVAAGAALAFIFRKQLGGIGDWIAKQFSWLPDFFAKVWASLPASVRGALQAVVNMVASAAKAVYHWLSYLNPFARHSPSLVENVTAGVDLIARKYASLRGIGSVFRQAINDLRAFGAATAAGKAAARGADRADMKKDVLTFNPQAGPAFDAVARSIDALYPELDRVGKEFAAQDAVVTRWKVALDAANDQLDAANAELKLLQKNADAAKAALDASQSRLNDLVNTPIEGMKAMNDAIFNNEMAQKALNLQIMKLEDAGGSVDAVNKKLADLEGTLETLRGQEKELRLAGAGSDVLGPLREQIAAIEGQRGGLGGQLGQLQALQAQLEELQRKGQELDLENSLKFDPLKKQIDDVTKSMKEMPFDELLSKIIAEQRNVDNLTTKYDQANAKVEAQKNVVDKLTAARDNLQATYDVEKKKLDELGDAYDGIEQQIRDMESALNDFASAASKLNAAKGAGGGAGSAAGNFADAGAGSFDVPGGNTGITNEAGDIGALADQWAQEAQKAFGNFDLFKPIKDGFNKTVDWLKTNGKRAWDAVAPYLTFGSDKFNSQGVQDFGDKIARVFKQIDDTIKKSPISNGWADAKTAFKDVATVVVGTFEVIKKNLGGVLKWFGNLFTSAGRTIGPELKKWGKLWDPFVEALTHIFNVTMKTIAAITTVIKAAWYVILAVTWAVWPTLRNVIQVVWDFIVRIVKAALEIIRGTIELVLAIINGDWGQAWDAIKTIFAGVWDAIYAILSAVLGLIWGIIAGVMDRIWKLMVLIWQGAIYPLVKGVWDAIYKAVAAAINFVWAIIVNTLRSIQGTWNAIWNNLSWFVGVVWNGIKGAVSTGINGILGVINFVGGLISGAWNNIWSGFKGVVDGVWDGIKTSISVGWGIVKGVINGIIRGINSIHIPGVHIPGWVPGIGGSGWDGWSPHIPELAQGAIIRARLGGTLVRAGEAGRDEAIVPLSPDLRELGKGKDTGKTFNFYGDLSFPNIKDGTDAEEFISNLESLVKA